MGHLLKTYFIAFIHIGLLTSCNSEEKEKNSIRKTFENYKNVVIDDKYDEAASSLDSISLAYYDTLLLHILHTDSVKVSYLPPMNQLAILLFRTMANTKELSTFKGRDLFAFSIRNKLIDKNDIMNAHIDKVQIDGQFAKGRLITASLMNEKEDSPKLSNAAWLNFYKEHGKWKINLTSVIDLANTLIAHEISEKHMFTSAFILSAIEMQTGVQPSPKIWKPILDNSR